MKTLLSIGLLLTLSLAACTTDDNPVLETSPDAAGSELSEVTVPMQASNDSGQTGQAVLTAQGAQTRVVVTLDNSPAGPQPIHIHPGTCDQLDPAPAYPLENVVDGRSETLVDVELSTLLSGDFAINVHKSTDEAQIYVSCGQIASS